jgi:pyridoxal phosphate enzyme (YggS family)
MAEIPQRLADIRQKMDGACLRARRTPASVRLIAVSKGFGPAQVLEAAAAGQRDFGESYAQEAVPKIEAVRAAGRNQLVWHFIGGLQANKTRRIAACFDWVHSVDRLDIAERLAAQRPPELPPLNVCVQVNLTAQPGRSGRAPEVAAMLCADIARMPRLSLRGLMTLPPASANETELRHWFRAMHGLLQHIRSIGTVDTRSFDTLSMGMSGDFEIAIEEGATLVRIGTAIFGSRS